jgi:putative glycosyltransferase (TIGR04348 family)
MSGYNAWMDSMDARPVVVIVTPAWADANNGNWQTASRWGRHLAAKHTVLLTDQWPQGRVQVVSKASPSAGHARANTQPTPEAYARAMANAQFMIALHARRSAASIQAWHQQRGKQGLAVVLTGTDLYKDLSSANTHTRTVVHASLEAAQTLVVLQDHATHDLPPEQRHKARVIFQSATARAPWPKSDPATRALRAVMVGHLREEKDPATLQQAASLLNAEDRIRIAHLGAALEPRFEEAALATAARCPHYRWVGACTHEQARRRIQRADVLVHTSRLEGGAHVIMEAVRSGTPVLASRMAGNVGMLGADYAGFFPVGDASALAQALRRFKADPSFRHTLQAQCALRAPLFDPAHEAEGLHALLRGMS